VDKLKIFPKENHERKQLEEIAHLYFSDPAPSAEVKREQPEPTKRFSPAETFLSLPRALFIRCAADRPEEALSTWFLFNLAVMLKILNGPVLLVGSERAYEKRFLFGFRPDRERVRARSGPPFPVGTFGPMGVCLLDGRVLRQGRVDGREGVALAPTEGRQVAFRYIVSDEGHSDGFFSLFPGLVLLLVTPASTTPGLLDRLADEEGGFLRGVGHVGIVIAGATCEEEADALYRYWRDRVEERCGEEPTVENFGVLPAEIMSRPLVVGSGGDRRFPVYERSSDAEMTGMGILEDPGGPRTRFCQAAAALIRRKRSEMLSDGP
jgi:hypothetical protein